MPLPNQVAKGSQIIVLFHLLFPEGKEIKIIERMDNKIPAILNAVLLSA
jgi:hypothetical protein